MRLLLLIFLTALFAAGQPVAAQTLDDAIRSLDRKEYEKARTILEKLATAGNTEAEFRLAEMYVRPIGIPQNAQRGMTLYQSAAQKGHPEALFVLATELVKGALISPDKNRAMGLFRTSAKLKFAGAQHVMCMELSTDGSNYYDAEEAYAWCQASSSKKHKQADESTRRGKEVLAKIQQAKSGAEAANAAKARAAQYTKEY
jgi:TPR repeat protein